MSYSNPSLIGPTEFRLTTTGNIDDLDFQNADIIRFNNGATVANLRGLKAGRAGQIVTVVTAGVSYVTLAHNDAGSLANNRLLNLATSAPTPMLSSGKTVFIYDVGSLRWRMVTHDQGQPITPTFNAADYTAGGAMTWTLAAGDVGIQTYHLKGNVMTMSWVLVTTTTAGVAANTLVMSNALYGGFTTTNQVAAVAYINDTAAISPGYANPAGASMTLTKLNGAVFNLVVDGVFTYGTITFLVQ